MKRNPPRASQRIPSRSASTQILIDPSQVSHEYSDMMKIRSSTLSMLLQNTPEEQLVVHSTVSQNLDKVTESLDFIMQEEKNTRFPDDELDCDLRLLAQWHQVKLQRDFMSLTQGDSQ